MIRTISALSIVAILGACTPAAPAGNASPRPQSSAERDSVALSAIVDSAGLHQALLTAPPVPAELRRKPLFTVDYDSAGALEEVRPISERMAPTEWARAMTVILRAHVRPSYHQGRAGSSHVLWLVSGSEPRITLLNDLVERRPALANTTAVTRELSDVSKRLVGMNPIFSGRRYTAQVSVRVTETGEPLIPVIRRSSQDVRVDREILLVARHMRFVPATVEGYPVRVLVSVPITIQFPVATPPDDRRRF
jgi:TonB family protein